MSCSALLFFFCLFLIPIATSAQGLIIVLIDDNGGGNGICSGRDLIDLDNDFNAQINIPKVFVTNLSGSAYTSIYNLPEGTPPMFLEFKYEETIINIPITFFEEVPYTFNYGNPSYTYFRSIPSSFIFNFADLCGVRGGDSTSGYGSIPINYTWRLVDELGNNYPIDDYSQPTEIFSCEAFSATCHNCSHLICDSFANKLSIITQKKCVKCLDDDILYNRYINNGDHKNIAPSLATISPNPFNGVLQLEYQMETAGNININIFNAQGQIVAQLMDQAEVGVFQKTIDTSQWSNGIYYFKIQSNHKSEAFRLIKTN